MKKYSKYIFMWSCDSPHSIVTAAFFVVVVFKIKKEERRNIQNIYLCGAVTLRTR